MNSTEHLLTCLAEEAGEVVQAVCKALRFGTANTDTYSDGTTNIEAIIRELNDLFAVVEMLRDEGVLPTLILDGEDMDEKQRRVRDMMLIATIRGTLQPESRG